MRSCNVPLALLAVFALAGCPAPPQVIEDAPVVTRAIPEPPPAPENNGEARLPSDVVPKHYALQLDIDPSSDTVAGRVTIDVETQAEQTWFVQLHARDLNVERAFIVVDGHKQEVTPTVGVKDGLLLTSPQPIEAKHFSVELEWSAKLGELASSLYRVQQGNAWYAFTQFEPLEARAAFPCLDEPGFKTTFDVTLRTPKGLVAAANTPTKETKTEGSWDVHTFERSKPMPTYLVAFAVGPFDVVDAGEAVKGVPLRILTPKGKGNLASYAAKVTPPITKYLTEYFGQPFPYAKLDMVAVPNFRSGAHMWFGNLVTLAWWDDLWLNEAFATWMSTKTLINVAPEFESHLYRVRSRNRVFESDALPSARKIRQPIEHQGDIRNAFDSITYTKGASVLHMLERWMGQDVFQKAVRSYMEKHAHGSATTADLVAELEKASGKPVSKVLSSYIDQAGLPAVSTTITCDGNKGKVEFKQSAYRTLGDARPPKEVWTVPACLTWHSKDGKTGDSCTLLEYGSGSVETPACPAWVEGNSKENGYYLWNPRDAGAWDTLFKKKNRAKWSDEFGVSVAGQQRALFQAGLLRPGAFVKGTLEALASSNDGAIQEGLTNLALIESIVEAKEGSKDHKALRKTFQSPLKKQIRRIGLVPAKKEAATVGFLRPSLVASAVRITGHKKAKKNASTLVEKFLKVPKSVPATEARSAMRVVAKDGDAALWKKLRAGLKKTKNPGHRRVYLGGLGAFHNPTLYKQSLDLLLNGEIKFQDYWYIAGPSFRDPAGRFDVFWAWFTSNFDAIRKLAGEEAAGGLAWVIDGTCDKTRRDAAIKFIQSQNLPDSSKRNEAQAVEAVNRCIALKEKHRKGLLKALSEKKK